MSKMSYEHVPLRKPFEYRPWHKMLDARAEQCPDTEAVVMYDMDKNRSTMTFALYRDSSMYLAASLLELGLLRGHNVLMISGKSLQCMVFTMALSRIGANNILVGPGSLTQDKVNLLKRLHCKMIAYDPHMKETQRKQLFQGINQLSQCDNTNEKPILISLTSEEGELSSENCYAYENIFELGRHQDPQKLKEAENEVQFDDAILAIFTSGSTGSPKVVQHTIHSLVNVFAETALSQLPCNKIYNDRPFSWIGGYIFCHSSLCTNMIPVCVPTEMALSETTNENVFEIVEKEKCTMFYINTALIHKLYTEKLHLKYNLSHIQVFSLGGQRFSLDIIAKLYDISPSSKVFLSYGCSESLRISADMMDVENAVEGKFGKMSIIPGVEVKVVDESEKVVSRGSTGEICVRSASAFLEYVDNPEATKQAKSPTGWLRTGDIGIMHDDGKIEVIGRKIEIIKRATQTIYPAEIEKVLTQHPNVADVVVVGIPDPVLHEEICACVVFRQDADGASRDEKVMIDELEDWCKEQFPPGPDGLTLKPRYIMVLKEVPMIATGKISIQEIKAEAMKQLGVSTGHI